MALRAAVLVSLLALALGATEWADTCPQAKGDTPLLGLKCGGFKDQAANRVGWITKLNLYHDGQCVTGIKPTYGYSSDGAQLLGRAAGKSVSMGIYPASGEFFTKIEAAGTGCITYLKIFTNGGRSIEVGKPVSRVVTFEAPDGLHLFGVKGSFGPDCAGPSLQFVWGTEKCEVKKPTVVAEVPLPRPAPQPVSVPVSVPVPTPTPVPVPNPTPVPVNVPTPTPVPVPVPSPIMLPVPVPSPVPFPIPVPTPSPVLVPTPTPVPVPVPTPDRKSVV